MSQEFVAVAATVILAVLAAGAAFSLHIVLWLARRVFGEASVAYSRWGIFGFICCMAVIGVGWTAMTVQLIGTLYEMLWWAALKDGDPRPGLVEQALFSMEWSFYFLIFETFVRAALGIVDILSQERERRRDAHAGVAGASPAHGPRSRVGRALRALERGSRRQGASANSNGE